MKLFSRLNSKLTSLTSTQFEVTQKKVLLFDKPRNNSLLFHCFIEHYYRTYMAFHLMHCTVNQQLSHSRGLNGVLCLMKLGGMSDERNSHTGLYVQAIVVKSSQSESKGAQNYPRNKQGNKEREGKFFAEAPGIFHQCHIQTSATGENTRSRKEYGHMI